MLVVTRNEGDSISFPELNMAIEVLKVHGTRVQIGVKAAQEIRVFRTELLSRVANNSGPMDDKAKHAFRNRLNAVSLAMSLSQKHLERGDLKNAELALQRVAARLHEIGSPEYDATTNIPGDVASVATASKQTRIHVLLVEDNANEGGLLAEVLSLNDVEVRVVHDGAEALVALQQSIPDVVLLDMHMPNRDGKSTLEQIRKDNRLSSIPVYAVTGAEQEKMGIKTCAKDGVNEWFRKPLQAQSLIAALNSLRSPHAAPGPGGLSN